MSGRVNIGNKGQPVPAPTYFDGRETRVEAINCALWDVRSTEPHATSYRVAEWVDAYLTVFDAAALTEEGGETNA